MPRTSPDTSSQTCPVHTGREKTPVRSTNKWSIEEHERYLSAVALYRNGSWKKVAEIVGTRTVRQVMSHAQKIAQKQQRHSRGLRPAGRRRRTTVMSPTAVEDVDTATVVPSPRHRQHRHSDPCEALPHKPFTDETRYHSGLQDDTFLRDEGYADTLTYAEDALIKVETSSNDTDNACSRWSEEDLVWFAELMRLNEW